MDTTPVSLLERLRRPHDAEAWGRFVELYTPLLYGWARQGGLQPSDAADLVQEVFLRLVQKLPEFHYDPHRSFRAWLHTVLRNLWRNRCREHRLPVRGEAPARATAPDDVAALAETEYRQHLAHRALQLMQTDFQPTTWKACWEQVVNDRPAAEVAAELGITANAVYLARARVLGRLRQELEGLLDA